LGFLLLGKIVDGLFSFASLLGINVAFSVFHGGFLGVFVAGKV